MKKNNKDKKSTIGNLFNQLLQEKNIEKRTSIITLIINHPEKLQQIFEFNFDTLLNKANHLENSNESEKLALWGNFVSKLFDIFSFTRKIDYQPKIFKVVCNQHFTNNDLKYKLILLITKNNPRVVNIDIKILESLLLFIIFNRILKMEDIDNSLIIIKSLKIPLETLSFPVCELFIDIISSLVYIYNIELYKVDKNDHTSLDLIEGRVKSCFDYLIEAFRQNLIAKIDIQGFIIFLVIFLAAHIDVRAAKFYLALEFQNGNIYQRELIDLIDRKKDIIKDHLQTIDNLRHKDLNLIELIANQKDIVKMIEDYIDFNSSLVKYKKNDYKWLIEKTTIHFISISWKKQFEDKQNNSKCNNDINKGNDTQYDGFVIPIPHDIIWRRLIQFTTDQIFFVVLLENVEQYIIFFGEEARSEWEYILTIIETILDAMIQMKPKIPEISDKLLPSKTISYSRGLKKIMTPPLQEHPLAPGFNQTTASHLNSNCSKEAPINKDKKTKKPIINQPTASNTNNKNIEEYTTMLKKQQKIFNLIYKLDRMNKFKGDLQKVIICLFKFPEPLGEELGIWKIKLTTITIETFIKNITQILDQDLITSTVSKCTMTYILHTIKENYYKVYENKNHSSKIDKILQEYNEKILKVIAALNNEDILSLYSSFIIDILILTQDVSFFEDMINKILNLNYTSNINNYIKNTLEFLLKKLLNLFAKEKLHVIFKCFNGKMNNMMVSSSEIIKKNTSIIKALIYIFKQFYVNQYYELHMNKQFHTKEIMSCLITFHDPVHISNLDKQNSAPYEVIKLSYFFKFCIFFIKKDLTDKTIVFEILSLLNKQFKYMFFLRTFKLSKLISKIFLPQLEELLKFEPIQLKSKIDILSQIFQIISFVNYHYINPNLESLPLNIQKEKLDFNAILQNQELKSNLKLEICASIEKYLYCMFTSMINNLQSMQPNSPTEISNGIDDSIKSIKCVYVSDKILNLTTTIVPLFLNVLEFYLFSLANFDKSNQTDSNFFLPTKRDLKKKKNDSSEPNANTIIDYYLKLVKMCKQIILLDYDLSFFLIKSIFMLKELLISYDQDKMIEIIYLLLCISWPKYEKQWTKEFNNEFQLNDNLTSFKPPIPDKQDQFNTIKEAQFKQINLVERFGDAVILDFIEKISQGKQLLRLVQKVLHNPDSTRQKVFLDLCKWNLTSRTNRDNIKSSYRWQEPTNADVYFDNNRMIMVIPIDTTTCELIVRSSIASVDMTITGNHSIWKKEAYATLDTLIKIKTAKAKPNISNPQRQQIHGNDNLTEDNKIIQQLKINDSNTYQSKKDYLFLNIYRQFSVDNFTKKPFVFPAGTINRIDSSPVYISIECGLIYYPNISCINTREDLLSYNGHISLAYFNFIKSLGKTFALNEENKNICPIQSVCKTSENLYAIYDQDTVFQLLYYCTNLLFPTEQKSIYEIRNTLIDLHHINLIWMENPYMKCNQGIVQSRAIVYIIIYPYSSSHYFIKLKFSNDKKALGDMSYESIIDMIKKNVQTKVTIHIDKECKELANYLKKIIIIIQTILTYELKKKIYVLDQKKKNNIIDYANIIEDNNLCSRYEKLYNLQKH